MAYGRYVFFIVTLVSLANKTDRNITKYCWAKCLIMHKHDRLIDYSLTSSADSKQYFCYFHEKNMIITDTKSVMGGTYGCLFWLTQVILNELTKTTVNKLFVRCLKQQSTFNQNLNNLKCTFIRGQSSIFS
jgi:hypothetical protein